MSNCTSFEDMRSSPRYRLRSHVNLARNDQTLDAHLLNISEGGALLAVIDQHDLCMGEVMTITIEREQQDNIQFVGHISHIKEHYIGLQCDQLSGPEHDKLHTILNELRLSTKTTCPPTPNQP